MVFCLALKLHIIMALFNTLLAANTNPNAFPLGESYTFEQFKKDFGKMYSSSDEEDYRRKIFYTTLRWIESNQDQTDVELQINHLSDMNYEEIVMPHVDLERLKSSLKFISEETNEIESNVDVSPHESFDWRKLNKLTPIRDQGKCGSCWAFSTVGTVEAAFLIKRNISLDLAEQELVDCSFNEKYHNLGCHMGYSDQAFQYIQDNGISVEKYYPYKAKDQNCSVFLLENKEKYFIKGYHILPYNSSDLVIMSAIKNHGPVTTAINVESGLFRNYKSGIMKNISPGMIIPDHFVDIVGFGTENKTDYWIIRNSWGTKWGQNGYGYVERHHDLMGINHFIIYPIVQ